MPVITNIEDLRALAEKRVPRMFYDYADSGSWTEGTYRANESDFQTIKLRQRVAVNMENRTTATTMVGQAVKMPVAIAPVGLTQNDFRKRLVVRRGTLEGGCGTFENLVFVISQHDIEESAAPFHGGELYGLGDAFLSAPGETERHVLECQIR